MLKCKKKRRLSLQPHQFYSFWSCFLFKNPFEDAFCCVQRSVNQHGECFICSRVPFRAVLSKLRRTGETVWIGSTFFKDFIIIIFFFLLQKLIINFLSCNHDFLSHNYDISSGFVLGFPLIFFLDCWKWAPIPPTSKLDQISLW